MFFQHFLKGIPGLDSSSAVTILRNTGIVCQWWSKVGLISPEQVQDRLTYRNLDWHLNQYDSPDPTEGNEPFGKHTPYISTTSGTVERDAWLYRNWRKPAFMTALRFATDNFATGGVIFYGYLFVLGKQTIPLQHFAEEVRELHVYTGFLPYHDEGEIVAKIHIPSVNLEKFEEYDGAAALRQLQSGVRPSPTAIVKNPSFAKPEEFSNIREVIT